MSDSRHQLIETLLLVDRFDASDLITLNKFCTTIATVDIWQAEKNIDQATRDLALLEQSLDGKD